MEWVWTFIERQLADNQFFFGGLVLMLGGALLAALRHVPGRIWNWVRERCIIEIDIPDREAAFGWLDQWLAAHSYSRERARRLTVRTEQPNYADRARDRARISGRACCSPQRRASIGCFIGAGWPFCTGIGAIRSSRSMGRLRHQFGRRSALRLSAGTAGWPGSWWRMRASWRCQVPVSS
jgi:hypothetical protein